MKQREGDAGVDRQHACNGSAFVAGIEIGSIHGQPVNAAKHGTVAQQAGSRALL
jgi:hypothetical protein